jgi:hypothetical protein
VSVIEMRRSTRTKRDVREHWKQQVSESFCFCALMFFSLLVFAVPALVLHSFLLVCLLAVILLAETVSAGRMFYAIYKYGNVGACRKPQS